MRKPMRIVTWNMGCNISASRYRKKHDEAWNYLTSELRPDIALLQEAVVATALAAVAFDARICELPAGVDAGTAVLVRKGLKAAEAPHLSVASSTYAATAACETPAGPLTVATAHVYPGKKQHQDLAKLVELLRSAAAGRPLLFGGDVNAARHFDEIYGGKRYQQFFDAMSAAGFYDACCGQAGRERQSFWGHQAKEAYQVDHFFVSTAWKDRVTSCAVIDNEVVRRVSDHGPLVIELDVARATP